MPLKLSNIRNFVRTGDSALNWKFTAEVDCTESSFFGLFKKTTTRKVARVYAEHWFFMDTGKSTPGYEMEALARPVEFLNGW